MHASPQHTHMIEPRRNDRAITHTPEESHHHHQVMHSTPLPGHAYMINPHGSDRAVTLTPEGLRLLTSAEESTEDNRWLCVERDGYFGFYNEKAQVFVGHDGQNGMKATATALREWEMFKAHRHREGGYELQSPFYWYEKRVVNASEDWKGLSRMKIGRTLWVFDECLNVG